MSLEARRPLGGVVVLALVLLAFAAPAGASVHRGTPTTFTGAFEFEGMAGVSAGKGCRGEGAFGVMKPGARVLLSERVASGDFQTLGKGKIAKGKVVTVDGDKVCRMTYKVKAPKAPASDSRVYLEVKGVTFDISWPAADVADGDLGIWTCEYSDNTCAAVVGRD
jgi:hypothetical protein